MISVLLDMQPFRPVWTLLEGPFFPDLFPQSQIVTVPDFPAIFNFPPTKPRLEKLPSQQRDNTREHNPGIPRGPPRNYKSSPGNYFKKSTRALGEGS